MRKPTGWYNAILNARKTESNIYPNQPSSTPTFLPGCDCYFIQTVHGYAVGSSLLSTPFCPASLHRLFPQAPDWISCSTCLLLSSWLKLLTFRSPLTLSASLHSNKFISLTGFETLTLHTKKRFPQRQPRATHRHTFSKCARVHTSFKIN